MPRYFFHLRTRDGVERDGEGIEFSNLQDAMDDARSSLSEMVAEELASGRAPHALGIDIGNDQEKLFAQIDVEDLIQR